MLSSPDVIQHYQACASGERAVKACQRLLQVGGGWTGISELFG